MMLCSSESSNDYEFFFSTMRTRLKEFCCDFTYETYDVTYINVDGATSIRNGVRSSFKSLSKGSRDTEMGLR